MGTINAEVSAKREQEVDDARKRRLFREAHNIPEVSGLAARLGLGTVEEEVRLAKIKKAEEDAANEQGEGARSTRIVDEQSPQSFLEEDAMGVKKESVLNRSIVDQQTPQSHLDKDALTESETDIRPKRRVRKWFGIW